MAIYKCSVCGYEFDEEKEGKSFSKLKECPICKQPVDKFKKIGKASNPEAVNHKAGAMTAKAAAPTMSLSYASDYIRHDDKCRYMEEIHEMAVSGHSIHGAMGTQMPMPSWDDILLLGAQLNPPPLDMEAPVITTTVIGKNAKRPMILDNPVYISHMSFGALSKEIKVALSKGSAVLRCH